MIDTRDSQKIRAQRKRPEVRPAPALPEGKPLDPAAGKRVRKNRRRKPTGVEHPEAAPTKRQLGYLAALHKTHRGEPSKVLRKLWKHLTRGKVAILIDELVTSAG